MSTKDNCMSAEDFKLWLRLMAALGKANSKTECAKLLGKTEQWVSGAQRTGCNQTAALACAALLIGAEPFKAAPELMLHYRSIVPAAMVVVSWWRGYRVDRSCVFSF